MDAYSERGRRNVTPRMRRVSRNYINDPALINEIRHASYEACE